MLNFPRIAYNKWRVNPLIRIAVGLLSRIYRYSIFLNTGMEPVIFTDSGIELGQATHPDLIYDECSGNFLMTVSNYPYGIARLENSFVLKSEDGIHFKNVLDSHNAIEVYSGNGKSHYSDGDMIWDGKSYSLYYRFCEVDNDKLDIISLSMSLDGRNWSKGKEIIKGPKDSLISPALLFDNGKYIMYYVDYTKEESVLVRSDSETNRLEGFYTSSRKQHIKNLPDGRMLWHINVSTEGRKLYGLFTLSTGPGGAEARLYYAEGNLDSDTWVIKHEINPLIKEKYIKKVYRSALVKVDDIWYLYMAVCTKNDSWFVARRKFTELDCKNINKKCI